MIAAIGGIKKPGRAGSSASGHKPSKAEIQQLVMGLNGGRR